MRISNYKQFINEDLVSDINSKLSDENKNIKEDVVSMIKKSINTEDEKLFMQKIDSIIRNPKGSTEGLGQDADIYDFYLKYRNEIDVILKERGFFDELQDFQKQTSCISLYDFVIKGTIESIQSIVGDIKKDLGGEKPSEQEV